MVIAMHFDRWARDIEAQLVELAEQRTFRFRATRRAHAAAYLLAMRRCEGLTDAEISSLETAIGQPVPGAYRAFVRRFGRARGHLFRGSDVEPRELPAYRADADGLVVGHDPLPRDAIVFLVHQGYTFCWFAAGDDPPVMQFVEGEGHRPCAPQFTTFVEAELTQMKQVNALAREQGGTFLTVTEAGAREIYPARSSGTRPIDTDDELL